MQVDYKYFKGQHIWVQTSSEEEKIRLLQYVKDNGFRWINGSEINPETDAYGNFIGLNDGMSVGYVPVWCWRLGNNSAQIRKMNLPELLSANILWKK